jgi:hypothetical protein
MSRSPTTHHAGLRSVGTHTYRGRTRMKSAGLHKTKASNARINSQMAAASAPTPPHQPTNAQLVGAGILKGN